MSNTKALGNRGEAVAAAFLERNGYKIAEKNFRCPLGEIDLIATRGEFLVFIEVKTRTWGGPLHPSLSVNARKQAKVRQVGEFYCSQQRVILQPRFDVIAVELGRREERVEHIENAF